ncbi:MAG: hypothetical protein B7W98_00595 [Parcubacteria group bacterium 20-58-5]|nr:MAG: hypothetical protein B7W98_00595 [Parcubacteria group bacterium 20-58-5]OYV63727.1 MAG: hypothetical protein B7X03_00605 [Parcubacteria group bacterium 21-58-10]HQT82767.1 DUF4147 domain-containing protein [Candidatus Paceibacterota bacterium]
MAHRIQNFESLATNALRTDALAIAEAGYAAIDVGSALAHTLHKDDAALHVGAATYPLAGRRVFFVGVGKCAFAAAKAVETILGDTLTGGVALDVSPVEGAPLAKIEAYIGTHPLPSEVNEDATKRIVEFLSGRREDDLVIMLISGGGSTLLCLHDAPMTCTDESTLWSELTARGATIQDINTVRKHISRARGGGLAFAAYPAEVISLIVSDVPGNDLEFIASGATVLDTSTVADAHAVLARFGIALPANATFKETPKDRKYFDRVTNTLFLTNQNALDAMRDAAAARGYAAGIADAAFAGEARDTGRAVVEKLHGAPAKSAFLYAGESTVTLGSEHGAGGRNQELALAALADVRDDELVLSFASDGHDNTDLAGAIGDAATRLHAAAHHLSPEEFLAGHRAYDFFKETGDGLVTGYTGSNVSDLIIAIKQ